MEGFQVDVILNSLQDLKQVRDENERKLSEECCKRAQLQTRLEAVSSTHSSASGRRTREQEALRVCSEQTSQAEAQASSLEQMCRDKREEVRGLNEKIEEQRQLEDEALSQFSSKMTELADHFRSARLYYTVPKLSAEVESCAIETLQARDKVSGKQARLAELRCSLRGLGGERDQGSGEDMDHSGSRGGGEGGGGGEGEGATEDSWHTLIDMLREEKAAAQRTLEVEEQRLIQAQQETQQTLSELEVEQRSSEPSQPTLITREE